MSISCNSNWRGWIKGAFWVERAIDLLSEKSRCPGGTQSSSKIIHFWQTTLSFQRKSSLVYNKHQYMIPREAQPRLQMCSLVQQWQYGVWLSFWVMDRNQEGIGFVSFRKTWLGWSRELTRPKQSGLGKTFETMWLVAKNIEINEEIFFGKGIIVWKFRRCQRIRLLKEEE